MTITPSPDAFRLSRIFAEGWGAARKLSMDERDGFDAAKIDAINPYSREDERARWTQGFAEAIGR